MGNLDLAITIALLLTIVGLVSGCIRMLRGPSAADRVVSLDFVTILLIAITSLLALQLDNAAYLDLGLALALIGFLATVAFARYVERNPPLPSSGTGSGTKSGTGKNDSGTQTQVHSHE